LKKLGGNAKMKNLVASSAFFLTVFSGRVPEGWLVTSLDSCIFQPILNTNECTKPLMKTCCELIGSTEWCEDDRKGVCYLSFNETATLTRRLALDTSNDGGLGCTKFKCNNLCPENYTCASNDNACSLKIDPWDMCIKPEAPAPTPLPTWKPDPTPPPSGHNGQGFVLDDKWKIISIVLGSLLILQCLIFLGCKMNVVQKDRSDTFYSAFDDKTSRASRTSRRETAESDFQPSADRPFHHHYDSRLRPKDVPKAPSEQYQRYAPSECTTISEGLSEGAPSIQNPGGGGLEYKVRKGQGDALGADD